MQTNLAAKIVNEFEAGRLSRRQLVTRLMGLGAAVASLNSTAWAQDATESNDQPTGQGSTFQATGLDHIALNVTDVARSREFYQKHLGLRVIRGTGDDSSFLGAERDFFLALFRADQPGLNHYCYAIRDYHPGTNAQKLTDLGMSPRRTQNRVYFPDPDGITVQIAGR